MPLRRAALVAAILGLAGASADARPPHKKALADHFGPRLARKLNDCRTCHVVPGEDDDPEDKPHNAFGARLKAVRSELRKAGKPASIPDRIAAVADEDSDGDGVANILELLAGHFPGEADDTPTADETAAARAALPQFLADAGAPRWSPFEPLKRPEIPVLPGQAQPRNPIDAFLAAERARRGLTTRPEADRATLLRRVSLDLIGLPPTPEELHAFLDDPAPEAFETVVDRLLASPRYGERWGRHWMDVWRYSDWAGWGEQVRDSQPHIWRWRDWIIESLNADKPYDRMIVEMLAADEVAPEDPGALRATGYLVRNFKLLSREKWMQDAVDHTGQAFLGVTIGCARCHDHMYDPITQKEYYRVRAIFEPYNVRIDKVPGQPDPAKDGLPRAFDADLAVKTFLFIRGDDRNPSDEALAPGVPEALGGTFPAIEPVPLPRSAVAPDRREFVIRDALAAAEAAVAKARAAVNSAKGDAAIEIAREDLVMAEARHAALAAVSKAELLDEAGKKDTEAWRDAALAATAAQRALAVAEARQNEAKARRARRTAPPAGRAEADKAAADAIKALVRAEEAAQAEPTTAYTPPPLPTYPAQSTGRRLAFARWIAARDNPLTARVAVNHIWARHFGRGLVPSTNDFGRNGQPATHPALLDWLAAEFMDAGWSMKAIHRLIVTSDAYRLASTPEPAGLAIDPDNVRLWRFTPRRAEAEVVRDCLFAVAGNLDTTVGGPEIDHARGLDVPRRSVYFRHAAEKQMEFLKIFDAAGVTECYQRKDSILPQQALALVNSDLALKQARRLAGLLQEEVGSDPDAFISAAFERVLSRRPTDAERAECLAYLNRSAATCDAPEPSARLRESLVHVLLNHHEFVTIR
jgi:hypothetical protein